MSVFGLPAGMTWVFIATVVAGSLGAVHYLVWHVVLANPVEERPPLPLPGEVAAGGDEGASPHGSGDRDV